MSISQTRVFKLGVESSHAARNEIGAGTKRRAGNAEVVRIHQDPRLTSKP
jgi:hypothetical protein